MHPSLSKRIARVATALEGLDKPVVAAKSSDSVVYVEHNNKRNAKTFSSIAAAKKYINDIDTGYGQGRPSNSSPWVRESGKRKNKQGELVEFEGYHGGPSNAYSIYKETPVKSARLKSALAEGNKSANTPLDYEDLQSGKGKSFKLVFLPYIDGDEIIGYTPRGVKRGYGYGRWEEFFNTEQEARHRMKFLIDSGSIEEIELRKAVPGQGMVTTLMSDWNDREGAENTASIRKHVTKRALAEGKDKLPTEINLDKATPKRIAPIVNNVDGRLKNIDKYTDALVTALEAKKEDKVKSVMKSLKTQIDALHKWLMQDVTRLVTASSKASYRQGEATIKRARTAYAKASRFVQAMDVTNKPLAYKGLTSYRYKGNYGWIMIGAKDTKDALNEANRSLSHGKASVEKLQVWDGSQYVPVNG